MLFMTSQDIVQSIRAAQQKFATANNAYLAELDELIPLIEEVFSNPPKVGTDVHALVFGLGLMAAEEFVAIHLLAASDFGAEALKLLRSMCERTISMGYLSKRPKEVEVFFAYHEFEAGRLALEARESHPDIDVDKELLRGYNAAQTRFARKPVPAWSSVTMKEMAKTVGFGLPKAYVACYRYPTLIHHTTPSAVAGYLRHKATGGSLFLQANSELARHALACAYWLLITVLEIQNDHFKLGAEKKIREFDDRMTLFSGRKEKLQLADSSSLRTR